MAKRKKTPVSGAKRRGPPDDHAGIPRDAEGNPVFLILPEGVRATYHRRMAAREKAWAQTGDPAAIGEAAVYTFSHRQPQPKWLCEAIVELTAAVRTKSQVKRARDNQIHFQRYELVRDAKYIIEYTDGRGRRRDRPGITWDRAYETAAKALAGSPAAGDEDTMRASYMRVKADLKQGRVGLYQTAHNVWNRQAGKSTSRMASPRTARKPRSLP